MSKQYTSTPGDYADLDRFNRVVTSKWTKDITAPAADVDFFNVAVGWDRNSNVTYQDDSVHDAFGAAYTNDDLNRLIVSSEGLGTGGTISTLKRKQEWTLTQTGNWTLDKLDLNGDADWSDTDEWQDGRTHNDVNELTARDLDNNSGTGGDNYSLAYDAAGNLTDDGTDYEYEWDAFYRLRKVKKTSNQALVAEYRYNGLGYRIAEHADTDTDGDVDGNDKWFYFAYDNRWRLVATFRESDTSPKEEFCHHHAGMDGSGSYIDLVAFRDKDANTAWTTASDTVLEERLYYCQNWRADVVAIVSSAAAQKEQVRYSAYGVPFGLPAGDADSDGDCDAADGTIVTGWKNAPSYDVRGDIDLDGDVDTTDESAVSGLSGTTMGRGVLSGARNRKGYAAYEGDGAIGAMWHVRERAFAAELGRWLSQDPIEYADGPNLFAFAANAPVARLDGSGMSSAKCSGSFTECTPTSEGQQECGADGPVKASGDPKAGPNGELWRLYVDVTQKRVCNGVCNSGDGSEVTPCRWRIAYTLKIQYSEDGGGHWNNVTCGSNKQDPKTNSMYMLWHGQYCPGYAGIQPKRMGSGVVWTGLGAAELTDGNRSETQDCADVSAGCGSKEDMEWTASSAKKKKGNPVVTVSAKISLNCRACMKLPIGDPPPVVK